MTAAPNPFAALAAAAMADLEKALGMRGAPATHEIKLGGRIARKPAPKGKIK